MRFFEFAQSDGSRLYPLIKDIFHVLTSVFMSDERVGCAISITQEVGGSIYLEMENDSDEVTTRFCFRQDEMLDTGISSERQYGHLEFWNESFHYNDRMQRLYADDERNISSKDRDFHLSFLVSRLEEAQIHLIPIEDPEA